MKILEFLTDLVTDAELMAAFRRSPQAALSSAGLTEQQQQLLLAGHPLAIRHAVNAENTQTPATRFAGVETMVQAEMFPPPPPPAPPGWDDPNPTPTPDPDPEPDPVSEPGPGPDVRAEMYPPPAGSETRVVESMQAESMRIEPPDLELDLELDLAQDAVLAGISSAREMDRDPSGIWSSKGLTVVGMGMRAGLHMTVETKLAIEQASRVLYIVGDPVSEACIRRLNPAAVSLGNMYERGKPRIEIYESIIARILGELDSASDVCFAIYGHPGVLAYPAWESIRRARATGKRARMLPAISTEDSLFADLGIDIGRSGMQSFEATRFLFNKYNFDPCVGLVLWQISVLGERDWNLANSGAHARLEVLTGYLMKFYGPEHEVFLYHAPEFPTSRPLVERVALRDLPKAEFIAISTLYIPPAGQPERNEENILALAQIEVRR
jgi:hypothetical protein